MMVHQGRRKDWLARELGVSPSYVTKLLNGKRRWTPALREKASDAFGVPETLLFLELEVSGMATEVKGEEHGSSDGGEGCQ